jgi:hypothetical protein
MLTLSCYYNIHIYFFPLRSPYRARRRSLLQATRSFFWVRPTAKFRTFPYVVARARQRRVRLNLMQATGVFSDSDEPYGLQSQDNFLTLRIVGHRSVPT